MSFTWTWNDPWLILYTALFYLGTWAIGWTWFTVRENRKLWKECKRCKKKHSLLGPLKNIRSGFDCGLTYFECDGIYEGEICNNTLVVSTKKLDSLSRLF